MAEAVRRSATYGDLARFPEGVHVEVIGGEVFTFGGALARHGRAGGGLSHFIGGPFDFDPHGPGGWWIVPEEAVELPVGRLFPPPREGELPQPMTVSEALAAYGA
jgi:hypothetical protein